VALSEEECIQLLDSWAAILQPSEQNQHDATADEPHSKRYFLKKRKRQAVSFKVCEKEHLYPISTNVCDLLQSFVSRLTDFMAYNSFYTKFHIIINYQRYDDAVEPMHQP
jgi:hypothetical protein